ncbi:MAG: WD40 repeat domain-containing protein [Xenococcaceae cyanobacterium MO_188.B32]|nr:WD40 repeat domain-containing protein [Xenococcaceae cyanobacterium MO_188.B32]
MKSQGKNNQSLNSSLLVLLIGVLANLSFLIETTQASPYAEKNNPKLPKELISTENNSETESNSSQLEFKSTIPRWRRVRLVHNLEEYQVTVDSLVFSPNNRILISGSASNNPRMKFFSVETGKQLTEFSAHPTGILALAVSPDGNTLVSSGEDPGINFWDLRTGEFKFTLVEHSSSVTSLAISPDNQVLVSGSLDGIRVWRLDYHPQRPLYTLANRNNPVTAMVINSNGYLLASGNMEGKVQFWNLTEGTFISEFAPHQEDITGMAFSPDGNNLITASGDRTIKIWDLASGRLLTTLVGHRGAIRTIALHPDGRTLASGGDDGIILWDIDRGEVLTRLRSHQNWVQSLAFSADGEYLASGGFDATVKIWQSTLPASTSKPADSSE